MHYVQYQYFLLYILLIWGGCVRNQRTRLPTGLGQLSLASLRGRLIEFQLRLGKGGNVTSAGWQVTLCDPMRHVSSRSGVATNANCYTLVAYLLLLSDAHLSGEDLVLAPVPQHVDQLPPVLVLLFGAVRQLFFERHRQTALARREQAQERLEYCRRHANTTTRGYSLTAPGSGRIGNPEIPPQDSAFPQSIPEFRDGKKLAQNG